MMRRLIYRPKALAELNEIAAYTRRTWGEAQSKHYVRDLVRDIKSLRTNAMRYPPVDHDEPDLRRRRSAMHHIYYRVAEDSVEIVRILHVQSDPAPHL